MVNPFDLRGPEFLAFYVILGLAVTAAVAILRRGSEPPAAAGGPLTDYLKIAYLRGGTEEALRVAILALLDRGLLERVDDHTVKAAGRDAPAGLHRTEQRLLEESRAPVRASSLIADDSLRVTAAAECESPLVRAGLLPDTAVRQNRQQLLLLAGVIIGGVALLKIAIALSRGRTNIAFLIIAAAGFGFLIYKVANPFRTRAGDAMLADLQMLFSALRDRASQLSLGSTAGGNELPLAASVFGIGSLALGGGSLDAMFRKPMQSSGASCGSYGSSCGSSCGGGCGGGCGGCGS